MNPMSSVRYGPEAPFSRLKRDPFVSQPTAMRWSPPPVSVPEMSTAVDISGTDTGGGDQRIAVGWETNGSLFSRLNGASGPYRTEDMGFIVDYVVLSQDGLYLAVAGNERPFTNSSRAFIRQYGPLMDPAAP